MSCSDEITPIAFWENCEHVGGLFEDEERLQSIEIIEGKYYLNGQLAGHVLTWDSEKLVLEYEEISDNKYINGQKRILHIIKR